jgi:ribosomal protein S18 acetylase RimI-like enzyme
MTWDDFDRWAPLSLRGAAAQLVTSGLLPEPEAAARVAEQFADQLPAGIATPLHHLWTVRSTGRDRSPVGHLWMRVRPSALEVEAFVLDVEILPELRGHGWGTAAMVAAEQAARDVGASVVRLNVYGHNAAGIRLYEALGYDVVSATLLRVIDPHPPPAPPGTAPQRSGDLRVDGTEQHTGSAPRLWRAFEAGEPVADVWMRLERRSDGDHAFVQELRLWHLDRMPAVVVAVERACRELGVRSLTLSAPGSIAGHPTASRVLVERCGFRGAAQTMAKALPAGD